MASKLPASVARSTPGAVSLLRLLPPSCTPVHPRTPTHPSPTRLTALQSPTPSPRESITFVRVAPARMPAAVSHKALHRPGKVPSTSTLTASFPSTHAKGNNARPKMARKDSIVSLPSPPMEERFSRGVENELDDTFGLGGSRRDQFADSPGTAASSDSEGLPVPHSSNPFLRPQPQVQQCQETYRPAQPDHPQSSPTQARRRVSKEAITLRPAAVVEMAKQAGGEVDSWNDADNPFVVRPGDAQKRWVSGKAPRPEKLTYVLYVFPLPSLLTLD
jgi:hypothetical protein